MYSKTPKVLFNILGKSMLSFVIDNARAIESGEVILVVGKNFQQIKKIFKKSVRYAFQPVPLGSGDAALKGLEQARLSNVLILSGDVPLLRASTLQQMIEFHHKKGANLTILTCRLENPFGYGRIIRDRRGRVRAIIEQTDATKREQKIKEVNAGVYYANANILKTALQRVIPKNMQGEYYLTDAVKELIDKKKKVQAYTADDPDEILGINTKFDLARARDIVKAHFFEELMRRGVYIEDPETTNIDLTVEIGNFVHIRPYTILEGNTRIKDGTTVGPFAWIKDGKHKKFLRNVR